MEERDIRGQTENILGAYRSLTGIDAIPSIQEFLQIRSAAVTELTSIRQESRTEEALSRPAPLPPAKKERQHTAGKSTHISQPHTAAPHVEPAIAGETEVPEKPKSDFEILRSMKDSWN